MVGAVPPLLPSSPSTPTSSLSASRCLLPLFLSWRGAATVMRGGAAAGACCIWGSAGWNGTCSSLWRLPVREKKRQKVYATLHRVPWRALYRTQCYQSDQGRSAGSTSGLCGRRGVVHFLMFFKPIKLSVFVVICNHIHVN
jgi:hypothetical protein